MGRKSVNVMSREYAQQQFADLLKHYLRLSVPVKINQMLTDKATLLYRHSNQNTLQLAVQGMLAFSNNFMANQLFLQFDPQPPLDFNAAKKVVNQRLQQDFQWEGHYLAEGAGLSRQNRLSSLHIDDLLKALSPYKRLLKAYPSPVDKVGIRAKSGTLKNVRTLAGYIDFSDRSYRFVFMFNRSVSYRYREHLLVELVKQLALLNS